MINPMPFLAVFVFALMVACIWLYFDDEEN